MAIFVFRDTATPEIYTLSLHDALPICSFKLLGGSLGKRAGGAGDTITNNDDGSRGAKKGADRKSTRLNSSHRCISYAVFCLKKKKKKVSIGDKLQSTKLLSSTERVNTT